MGMGLIYSYYSISEDIDVCARKYQMFGYAVNKYIASPLSLVNLIALYSTRYYFNFFSVTANVHLNNIIESEEVVSDIESRLENGLRMWDITKGSIGDYRYDNVEKDYLS